MEKRKPEQITEQSATAPVQTQDPVVVAMSERKPNPEESVQGFNSTEDANIKKAIDTGSTPANHSEPSADRAMSPKKSVHWSPELVSENSYSSLSHPDGSNPYVSRSVTTPSPFNFKETVSNVRDVLGRWGKKVGEVTKKADVLAGNTWQHCAVSCLQEASRAHDLQSV